MGGQEARVGDSTTYLSRYVRQYMFYTYHTHGGLLRRPHMYVDNTGDSALTMGGLEPRDILCQCMAVAHASCVDDGSMYLSRYVSTCPHSQRAAWMSPRVYADNTGDSALTTACEEAHALGGVTDHSKHKHRRPQRPTVRRHVLSSEQGKCVSAS